MHTLTELFGGMHTFTEFFFVCVCGSLNEKSGNSHAIRERKEGRILKLALLQN